MRASRRVSSVGELAGVARLEEDVAVGYSEEGTFAAVAQTLGIFREWKVGFWAQLSMPVYYTALQESTCSVGYSVVGSGTGSGPAMTDGAGSLGPVCDA